LVGSLKSGKSLESTADKPSAIQITNPSNKKHQEYLTTNVEYLENQSINQQYKYVIDSQSNRSICMKFYSIN